MGEPEDIVDWRKLREFSDVDLTRSFVLSWHIEADTLCVDIDLFLNPEHPFYEKPRPAEKVCIRPAVIEFPYCESLQVDQVEGETLAELAGKIPHGPIGTFRRLASGHYEIGGDFGTVEVDAERPILRLKSP